MKKFFSEFRQFAMKGNVIDMAVGVMIGSAFSKIVSSLVADIFTPLVSLLLGHINFAQLAWTVTFDGSTITVAYGQFIQNVIDFIIMALCIFCFVKAINKMKDSLDKLSKEKQAKQEESPKASDETKLLTEIRDLLKKQPKKA